MQKVYSAGAQGLKVIAVMVAVVGFALMLLWWGADLYRSFGEVRGTGEPGPWWPRFAMLLLVVPAGLVLLAGGYYGRIYVLSLAWDDERRTMRVRSLLLLMPVTWEIAGADVRHSARVDLRGPRGGGDTPYLWVEVAPARRRPGEFMVDLQGRILDRPGFERALWGEAELPELPEQAEEPDPETRPPAPLLTQVYVLLWFVGALVGLYFTASLPLTTDNSPGQALAARWFGITGTLSVNDCHDQELADSDGKVTSVALTCLGDFTSDDGTFTASTLAVNAPRWSDAGRGLRASITDASSTLAYVRPDPFLWGLLLFSGMIFSMAALGLAWACSWPIREPIQRRRARRRRERGAVAGPGGERPTPGGP